MVELDQNMETNMDANKSPGASHTRDFLEGIDIANAELNQAAALCHLVTSNFDGTSEDGHFVLRQGIILEAVGDIGAKIERIKEAVETSHRAWMARSQQSS